MSLFFANKIFLIFILISVASLQWISQQRYLFFLVERVEFEKSCVFSLFGNNIECSFRRGSSREGHEVPNNILTPSQSLNAVDNQLDVFQFTANPN